jgi:CheY-like chemotaxis protein
MSLPPPLRVLVVDDEAPARRKVLRLLRDEEGVEVVGEADGGEAAIAAVRKHSPDLVFLDVQMPGVDGFGVMRSIVDAEIPLPRIILLPRTINSRFRP